jgi:plastocyanin
MRLSSTIGSLIVVLAVASAVATGCKSGPQPTDDAPPSEAPEADDQMASVVLYRYRFNPNELTIQTGTTVEFQNKDVERHVVSIEALGIEHDLSPGDTWSHTFDTTGTFTIQNPRLERPMEMTLVVE